MTETNNSRKHTVIARKMLFCFRSFIALAMGEEINDFDRSDLHRVGTQSDLVNPTSVVEGDMWITSSWSRKRDSLIEFNELVNFQVGEECFDSVI